MVSWISNRCVLPLLVWAVAAACDAADDNPFSAAVTDVRPRIFFRADDAFDGLTLAKFRERLADPEFRGAREKWSAKPLGRAILWMLDGRREDLNAAIAGPEENGRQRRLMERPRLGPAADGNVL